MWELDHKESWALKNWCFWTVVLEKTLENPWTERRANQSILKEISPEYSLEGYWRILKLKLQHFGHLMQRADSLEKIPMLWKMASRTQQTWVWASAGRWWRTGKPGVLQSLGSKRVGHDWATEQQQERNTLQSWFSLCLCRRIKPTTLVLLFSFSIPDSPGSWWPITKESDYPGLSEDVLPPPLLLPKLDHLSPV